MMTINHQRRREDMTSRIWIVAYEEVGQAEISIAVFDTLEEAEALAESVEEERSQWGDSYPTTSIVEHELPAASGGNPGEDEARRARQEERDAATLREREDGYPRAREAFYADPRGMEGDDEYPDHGDYDDEE
jgi:hypothetical protein